MSVDAVPYLDDRQTSRIVALDQQLARTAARSVNDARNDRAKKVAELDDSSCPVRGTTLRFP